MFLACAKGYSDRLRDQNALSVSAGYWVAYYSNSKHPKQPDNVVSTMYARSKNKNNGNKNKPKPDIDTYLKRERRRLEYLKSIGKI